VSVSTFSLTKVSGAYGGSGQVPRAGTGRLVHPRPAQGAVHPFDPKTTRHGPSVYTRTRSRSPHLPNGRVRGSPGSRSRIPTPAWNSCASSWPGPTDERPALAVRSAVRGRLIVRSGGAGLDTVTVVGRH